MEKMTVNKANKKENKRESKNVTDEIVSRLNKLEAENDVKVLFAIESGSRAWGFESEDSDYDVRFIYLRPRDWYLDISVEAKRDVIDLPIEKSSGWELDMVGWDLRKALKLLAKSNPSILEWLSSPVTYRDNPCFVRDMHELAQSYFSPVSAFHHYLSMAKKNYRGYLRGEAVRLKKYFYVLRPLLCVRWIMKYETQPPMEFENLLNDLLPDGVLRNEIDALIVRKRSGLEVDNGKRISALNDYIELEINQLEGVCLSSRSSEKLKDKLNQLFLDQLAK